MRGHGRRARTLVVVALLAALPVSVMLSVPAHAGPYVEVRVSVKRILSSDFVLPGWDIPDLGYSDFANVQAAFDRANDGNERFGRPWRYVLGNDFEGDVVGWSKYYRLEDDETTQFEIDARANAAAFFWRNDAVNLYITHRNLGTVSNPACAGWASQPGIDPPLPGGVERAVVVIAACASPPGVAAHEMGHHWGLIHTWVDDLVADTPTDANPEQCFQDNAGTPGVNENCNLGGSVECCCATKVSLTVTQSLNNGWTAEQYDLMRYNLMSYHCDTEDVFELSEGQLDRRADVVRLYRQAECTGVVWFVDRNNISSPWTGSGNDPYETIFSAVGAVDPAGGDVLVIRPGTYSETLTISNPVTLWAPRTGSVRIGG